MLEVLACAHQPLPTQQLFLSEFLHTVQVDTTFVFVYFLDQCFRFISITSAFFELKLFSWASQSMGKTYEVHGLQLPVINMLSLKVIYEDHRTYASSTAVSW